MTSRQRLHGEAVTEATNVNIVRFATKFVELCGRLPTGKELGAAVELTESAANGYVTCLIAAGRYPSQPAQPKVVRGPDFKQKAAAAQALAHAAKEGRHRTDIERARHEAGFSADEWDAQP